MYNYTELEFKGCRRDYYSNPEEYPLKISDHVVVQAEKGIDLGRVVHLLDKVSPCMKNGTMFEVLRKASREELKQFEDNRIKESNAKPIAKSLFKKHELDMKLSDIEYQFDANKITFYFTADERVDFRELVRDLAQQFKARIELRQINAREEARKIGGCGRCGQQLCCTTCILKEFKPITTQYAKDQMMSTNPSKLTGMCGRLRCCLRYELPIYQEVLHEYPEINTLIKTPAGDARVENVDIFKGVVLLRFQNDAIEHLPLEDVQLLMAN